MKSLALRFLLPFTLVTVLFSAFVLYRAHTVSERHVRELLQQQMALAMEFNLAIREYAGEQIRPAMERLVDKDEFHPETMSTSFISRRIFERVQKNFPECIIRFASDDPRNPINKATPDEHRVIEYFRANPTAPPRIEEIEIQGRRYLAHFTPRWMKSECLRCHGDPKDAPAAMVARYGATASFHRKVGEIMALDTVAVPLNRLSAALAGETRRQSWTLLVGLLLLFGAVMVLFRLVVTRRLAAIASHFHGIANHPESDRLKPLPVTAKDEIGLVGGAFNQMVEHLRQAQASLEERVRQRTADLATANEELRREVAQRQRAEAALAEEKRFVDAVVQTMPDIVFVFDLPTMRPFYHNRELRELLDYPPAEAEALGRDAMNQLMHPEDLPKVQTHFEEIRRARNGVVLRTDYRMRAASGEYYWFQTRDTIFRRDADGQVVQFLSVTQNITELKAAEAALRESEAKARESARLLEALFDAIPDVIGVQDRHRRIVRYNAAGYRFLGLKPEETHGRVCYELIGRVKPCEVCATAEAVLTKQAAQVEKYVPEMGMWLECRAYPVLDEQGEIVHVIEHLRDITGRKQAELQLRDSEALYHDLVETSQDLIWQCDAAGRYTYLNPAWEAVFGYRLEEMLGRPFADFQSPEDAARDAQEFARLLGGGSVRGYETVHRAKDGRPLHLVFNAKSVTDETGRVIGTRGTAYDITERKQAETALRQRGEDLARLLEVSKTLAVTLDLKTVLQAGTDNAARLLGLGSAAIYFLDGEWLHLAAATPPLPPEMPESFRRARLADHPRVQEALTTRRPVLLLDTAAAELTPEERAINQARGLRTLVFLPLMAGEQTLGTLIVGSVGTPRSVSEAQIDLGRTLANLVALAVVNSRLYEAGQQHVADLEREVAERQRAEAALRASEAKFSKAFHTSPDAININRLADGAYVAINQSFSAITGYSETEVLGRTSLELGIWNNPEDRQRLVRELREKGEVVNLEFPFRLKDGRVGTGLMSASLIELDGEPHILSITRDISDRKRAEDALAKAELRVRTMLDNVPEGIVAADVESRRLVFANETFCRMVGRPREELLRASPASLHPAEHRDRVLLEFERMMRGESQHATDIPVQRKDGSVFPVEIKSVHAELDGRACVLATFTDITELKQAEERQEKLQSQLTQAQKMESIGRLAGGVAHDFNNMLQAILGNAALALQDLPPDSPARESLEEIEKSARRSADLTRQLLAFARKQTIAPKVLDLNDTVAGMLKMLRRLIGEDIDLSWMPGANLWPVKMDPSQLDQVLANLCVNARDAISGVGTVTIETTNVTLDDTYAQSHPDCVPGDYVMLAVSDTGKGMDDETRAHLFEPFFTTKAQGKGTGLGLATVFGIVKQNHGLISVYSEPGQGSTFKLYLPRAEAEALAAAAAARKRDLRGTETVLLVEDEDQILNLAQRILQQHGYTVLAARSPKAAVTLATQHAGRIDLLITDVVMPGMNGRELRQRLAALHPELRCLYMSGYTANVIAHHGVLDAGVQFLQKPFTIESLAEKVRETLQQPPESSPG